MKRTFSFGGTSGQIAQLGIVVADVDAAMRFCAEHLHFGPFICWRNFRAPDGLYRGSKDMPKLTLAQVYAGRFFIEFIQQHDDTPSVYTEFIEKHGYGLHHYGLAVAHEDYDATLEHYFNNGFEVVFSDTLPGNVRIRYLAPKDVAALEKLRNETGVSYVELIEMLEDNEASFADMVEASLNWDGKTVFLNEEV